MPRTFGCPSCGAALRPDAQWCSLCYHDLRPAPPVAPVTPPPAYGGLDPLTAPLLDLVLPPPAEPAAPVEPAAPPAPVGVPEQRGQSWPCSRCGSSTASGPVP